MKLPDLVCVDPKRIDEIWPHAKHLIKSGAQDLGAGGFDRIESEVLDGKQLLWLAWDGTSIEAAATTQLVGENCQPTCVLTACGGHHIERWLHLFAKIEQYAKDEGCSHMRIFGRPGWQRVLEGYRVKYVTLEKILGN